MKSQLLFTTALFVLIPTFLCASSDHPESKQGIPKYLPEENELINWKTLGSPQTARGENLFHLINGGAEIYHEYGFKSAVIQSYERKDGLSLNIEIYEMEDAWSAFGAFSFKTGSQGEKADVGMEALLEDYYLNFWKGEFVVTLIGFDTSPATQEALKEFARKIDLKLPERNKDYPPLIKLLRNLFDDIVHTVYMEGNLALYNQYEFDTQNLFGVNKGAAASFSDHTLFLLEYRNKEEAQSWFQNAEKHLNQNQRFHGFKKSSEGIHFRDDKENSLFMSPFQNTILIYLGKEISKAGHRLEKLKKAVSKN